MSDETISEFETLEEAMAFALGDVEPGGVVVVHDETCEQRDGDEDSCTCEPLELVVGAKA